MSHNAAMLDVYEGALRRLRAGTFRLSDTGCRCAAEPKGGERQDLVLFYEHQIAKYIVRVALEGEAQ